MAARRPEEALAVPLRIRRPQHDAPWSGGAGSDVDHAVDHVKLTSLWTTVAHLWCDPHVIPTMRAASIHVVAVRRDDQVAEWLRTSSSWVKPVVMNVECFQEAAASL